MKKLHIFLAAGIALSMASCTEDFTTNAKPQSNEQPNILQVSDVTATTKTVDPIDYSTADPAAVINLGTVAAKQGQLPSGAYLDATVEVSVKEDFSETATIKADTMSASNQNIMITVQELQDVINSNGKGLYLKNDPVTVYVRSTLKVINGTSSCYVGDPETTYFAENSFTYTPKPVLYGDFLYYVGTTGGWNEKETGVHQRLILTDLSKGQYQGYFYQKEESYGNTFRFLKSLGSWDNAIGYSDFTTVTGDVKAGSSDNNFEATAGSGLYYFDINLVDKTISVMKINYISIIGGAAGWNTDRDGSDPDLDNNFCITFTNAGCDTSGWKFRTNHDWGNNPNLGGTIDNLSNNGDNLTVAGSTVKLYPCRTNSDKIYCTVE